MSQIALKPQDIVIALKASEKTAQRFTYAELAKDVGLSGARLHASVEMLKLTQLATGSSSEGLVVNRQRLLELIIYGVPIVFPAMVGAPTRGMPTASALPEISAQMSRLEVGYVWPQASGSHRGVAVQPLHACVLTAAKNDAGLYHLLMAIDVLRLEPARERELAIRFLKSKLA